MKIQRRPLVGITLALFIACFVSFQNCGSGGFEVASHLTPIAQVTDSTSTGGGTPSGGGGSSSGGGTSSGGGGGGGGGGTTAPSVSLTDNASAPAISASSVSGAPKEGAVLQRNNQGSAAVQLSFNGVQASYYASKLISDGSVISSSNPGSYSSGLTLTFNVVTGLKSTQLRVSFYNSQGQEISRYTTPSFAVGEVFLIAGQSNSAGHGESPQASSQRLNRAFSPEAGSWVALQDPLPYATNWSNPAYGSQANPGGSAWPAMADQLSASLGVPVGIASVGWGGSSISEWVVPTGNNSALVDRLVKAASGISNCGFRAVLWHQGETDSVNNMAKETYKSYMRSIRSAFQSRTGCNTSWFVARASQSLPSINVPLNQLMNIRNAQTELWNESGYYRGPDTDLMNGRKYRFDLLHFSNTGLSIHGSLWAQKVRVLYGLSAASDISYISEAQQVMSVYRSVFGRTEADMDVDHNGLFYHTNRVQQGQASLSQLESEFRGSDEYFIRSRYAELARRAPTIQEVLAWNARIIAGEFGGRDGLSAALSREVR